MNERERNQAKKAVEAVNRTLKETRERINKSKQLLALLDLRVPKGLFPIVNPVLAA